MMTFDRVLPELLRVCETDPAFAGGIEHACAVRDPRGRVRLVLAPHKTQREDDLGALRSRLDTALATELEGFFAPPLLTTRDNEPHGKIARAILDKSDLWHAPAYDDVARGRVELPSGRWRLLERRLRASWLEAGRATEPWDLAERHPVIAFYSFKGGVGRTTALVSCALQLAEQGKRVAVVDLDLEAPGLGPLLGVDTDRGVLDALIDHLATGRVDLGGLHGSPQVLGPGVAGQIDVFPAGRLDRGFLEKLARLDFSAAGPWGDNETIPVHRALKALLATIRAELAPDYIFLDARAGLHDLAGLSLHGLAHVDVLITCASEQAYRGLDLTVETLARRKAPEDRLRCITVHGFAPPDPESPEGKVEIEEVRDRAYRIFSEHAYDDAPAETDQTVAHWPWPLGRNPRLERFTTIASVLDDLRTTQQKDLLRRVVELCMPENATEDEGAT